MKTLCSQCTHGVMMLLLSLMSAFVSGQNPDWQWANACGNSTLDVSTASFSDGNGCFYVCGTFRSDALNFGTGLLVNQGSGDLFLVKYSPTGDPVWAKSIGGTGMESGSGITTDQAGNVYVCGTFSSPVLTIGPVELSGKGGSDILLACFSPVGNIKWAFAAGGMYSDAANAVTVDSDGNILLAGEFQSIDLDFGGVSLTSNGSWDAFVAKISPNGAVVWAESAGGGSMESALGVETDLSGNVIITGFFDSQNLILGNDTLHTEGNSDIFLAKYSTSGIPEWARSIGSFDTEIGYDLKCDGSGNVYLTGSIGDQAVVFGSDTLVGEGLGESFLAKFDPDGETVWARSFGGSANDYANALAIDSANRLYVTGSFSSDTLRLDNHMLVNHGSGDVFIAAFDAEGFSHELFSLGEQGNEYATGISCGRNNRVFVTGCFEDSNLQIGPFLLNNAGEQDIFAASFTGLPAGLADTPTDPMPLVYPIPSDGLFRVNIPDQGNFSFELLSLTGSLLQISEITTGINTIHCPDLESGMYFYRITGKQGPIFSGKLIVK